MHRTKFARLLSVLMISTMVPQTFVYSEQTTTTSSAENSSTSNTSQTNSQNESGSTSETYSANATELSVLGQAVYSMLPSFKEIIQEQYREAEAQLKENIQKNNWDYEYTMLDFTQMGDPTEDVPYNQLFAAYTTVIYYGKTSNRLLADAPFISIDLTEDLVPGDETKKYGHVSFYVLDGPGLLSYYGLDPENADVKKLYEHRVERLENALTNEVMMQSVFSSQTGTSTDSINNSDVVTTRYLPSSDTITYLTYDTDPGEERRRIVDIAYSLLGKVPYQWGGKASGPGYDNSWWSYVSGGKQKGLDCSGFVQWVYMTAGYSKDVTDGLLSTSTIRHSLQSISKDELQPGDIGLLNDTDSSINHTGIYVGNGQWIHCASGKKTVVVNDFNFRYYKRAPLGSYVSTGYEQALGLTNADGTLRNESSGGTEIASGVTVTITDENGNVISSQAQGTTATTTTVTAYNTSAQNADDVKLLAQLIHHEAGNQGVNGMIAVGEVVMNRVKSSLFPNTIKEVVYQKGQFSGVSSISSITPSETELSIAQNVIAGNMKVFQNENVLFFRNPSYAGYSASQNVNWGSLKWYTSINQHAFYTK